MHAAVYSCMPQCSPIGVAEFLYSERSPVRVDPTKARSHQFKISCPSVVAAILAQQTHRRIPELILIGDLHPAESL